jgi:phage I-like protein
MRGAKKFNVDVSDERVPAPKIKKHSEDYKPAQREDGGFLVRQPRAGMTAGVLVSSCAVAIPSSDEPPEWIELIPAGTFSAVDGRGPFENPDPGQVIAASIAKMPQVGLVLDYDHATDLAAPEGRPAPAAGWLKEFKVDNGAIFARIEWTRDAAEAVKDKKYRYVSPVFEHSKEGKVERILRAALTNNPALINLPALAQSEDAGFLARQPRAGMTALGGAKRSRANESARCVTEGGVSRMAKKEKMAEEKSLSEIVAGLEELFPDMSQKQILQMAMGALDGDGDYDSDTHVDDEDGDDGMAAGDDPYEHEDAEQMGARQADEMARCSTDEEKAEIAQKHEAEKERFAKRVKGLEVTASSASRHPERSEGSRFNLEATIARHPMVVQMAADLNAMRLMQARKDAKNSVDAAIREGRLIPSQRDWAIDYCAGNRKGFDKFIGAQPRIINQGNDGTFTGRIGDAPQGTAALNARAIDIFANLGLESKEQLEKCAAVKEKWTLKFPRPRLMLDDSGAQH